jgi:hypothetical protein
VASAQVLIDEAEGCAAVEWVLRYALADSAVPEGRQLLGGTTFQARHNVKRAALSVWTYFLASRMPPHFIDTIDTQGVPNKQERHLGQ